MNRITPEFLVEEYKKSEFTPARGVWEANLTNNESDEPIKCGCAFTAIIKNADLLNDFKSARDLDMGYDHLFDFIEKNTKYTKSYALGFVHGYDGHNRSYGANEIEEEYIAGHEDGVKAWEVVLKELLNGKEIW